MEENKNLETVSKGWSRKNIKRGFLFLGIGLILTFFSILTGLTGIDSGKIPLVFYVIYGIALFFISFGVLGFWLLIPAFQKWRHTKKEWLAWTFLAIAIVLLCVLFYFRNMPI
jgi:membrane protease YdiL (CAAX protease family)